MPRTKKGKTPNTGANQGEKMKDISTQTSTDDDNIEIARLQEQIRLLTIENEVLRIHTAKMNAPTNNVNDTAPRPVYPDSKEEITPVNINSSVLNSIGDRTVNLTKSSKKAGKGCSCKGNCSTKVCGCMRKDKKCAESCKCNIAVCENKSNESDENKENTASNTIEEKSSQRVNNEMHKSLFSPDEHLFSPNVDTSENSSRGYFSYSSIRFGQTPAIEKELEKPSRQENPPAAEDVIKVDSKVSKRKNVQKVTQGTQKTGVVDNVAVKEEPTEPSNVAENSTAHENKNTDRQDPEVFPFKSKRQLPRTPPHANKGNKESKGNTGEILNMPTLSPQTDSDDSLPMLLQTIQSQPTDSKASFAVSDLSESVNWEEHQAQLKACSKCNRKFLPHRLKKHEACCKKV